MSDDEELEPLLFVTDQLGRLPDFSSRIETLRTLQPVLASRVQWMAVHGALCLALRYPGLTGSPRELVEGIVEQLADMLVLSGCLTREDIDQRRNLMRVNVYAEELTSQVELVRKTSAGGEFTGVRFYLDLPGRGHPSITAGPAAVTFWAKDTRLLRDALKRAVELLDGDAESHHVPD